MADSPKPEETILEYGFRWFEFHAAQRITTFNFYLVMYSGLVAVEAFFVKEKIRLGSIAISLILIAMSVLFWQLDVRNRQLISIGESILTRGWTANGLDETLNPVALSAIRQPVGFRYKELFGAIFALGAIGGVVTFSYAVYLATP